MTRNLLSAVCLGLLLSVQGFAAEKSKAVFSKKEKAAIEQIVREYLLENPELLVEIGQSLQKQRREALADNVKKAIPENADKLFNSLNSQIMGDPKGDVTIVQFCDHQNAYCKKALPQLLSLLQDDEKLRIVFKELPLLGEDSIYAAKAVLAARRQGKYRVFNQALLQEQQALNKDKVLALAESVNLNTTQLERDMQDEMIVRHLRENVALAKTLGISNTPTFIVASYPPNEEMKFFFVPGMPDIATFKTLIQSVREPS